VGGLLTGAVGVDVEPVDTRNDVLLRRIATDEDLAAVRELPRSVQATALVCAKESAFKAYRCGPQNLRKYQIRLSRDGRMRIGQANGKSRPLNLWLSVVDGYAVAVCSRTHVTPRIQIVGVGGLIRAVMWPSHHSAALPGIASAENMPGTSDGVVDSSV
jgi:phosphopantetheinyl transferase (holo-ACP synthase)